MQVVERDSAAEGAGKDWKARQMEAVEVLKMRAG